jgi:hypothetical protein
MNAKEKEVEELTSKLCEVYKQEIKELLKHFGASSFKFLDFEIALQARLKEIGRKTLEQAIPYLYGDGYVGSRFRSEEGDVYGCYERVRPRGLKTIFGKVTFDRARYYNEELGTTRSVTDILMDVEDKKLCPLLRYWCCLLGTISPFNEASDTLHKITGVDVSHKDIQNITEKVGKQLMRAHDQTIREVMLNEQNVVEPARVSVNKNAARKVYVETDGCNVPTRQGWKECKTLLLFEMRQEGDKNVLYNKHYFSSTRNVYYFKRQVKVQLEQYCEDQEVDLVCVGDGAEWIWNMIEELVPQGATQILDWYHVKEKVWELANELHPTEKEEGQRAQFVDEQLSWLRKGNSDIVLQKLVQLKNNTKNRFHRELIDKLLVYINNNKHRMHYDTYKKQGPCIGSGAIESANKYVIQRRLKLPGIRWQPENAEYMAHLRTEYINKKLEGFLGINIGPLLEVAET